MGSYTNGLTSESVFTYNDYYLANPYLQMLKDGKVPMSTIRRQGFPYSSSDIPYGDEPSETLWFGSTEEHYAAAAR